MPIRVKLCSSFCDTQILLIFKICMSLKLFSRCSNKKKWFCHWWNLWKGMGSEEKRNHAYKLLPSRIKQDVLCSWRKGEGLEFIRGVWFFEGTYACGLHPLTPAYTCLFAPVFFQFAPAFFSLYLLFFSLNLLCFQFA